MSKNSVVELSGREQFTDSLTEFLRTGARQLIQQVVEVELAEFMAQYKDQHPDNGRAAVVQTVINLSVRYKQVLGWSRSRYRRYGLKKGAR